MPSSIPEVCKKHKWNGFSPECDTFVYAAYLPPGLHQFVIYCPSTKRAFCKDIMIGLSESDHYPELPGSISAGKGAAGANKIGNVWRKWRGLIQDDRDAAFKEDTRIEKIFNP